MTRELHQLAKGRPPEDFRTASLGIPVLKHHALKVVLRLSIPIPEKRGLLCLTDDVGNSEVVAVDGHRSSKWVSGPSQRNYAEKGEDQSREESCHIEVLTIISSSHVQRIVAGDFRIRDDSGYRYGIRGEQTGLRAEMKSVSLSFSIAAAKNQLQFIIQSPGHKGEDGEENLITLLAEWCGE
jgi:hypothetical protein